MLKQLQLEHQNLKMSKERLQEEFSDFKLHESGKDKTRRDWEIKAKDELTRRLQEVHKKI